MDYPFALIDTIIDRVALLAIFAIIILVILNERLYQYCEYNVKWIEKESQLLGAISEDEVGLSKSGAHIAEKASDIWGSEFDSSGFTLQLDGVIKDWLKQSTNLATDVKRCVNAFKELCGARRYSLRPHKLISVWEIAREIDLKKKEIESLLFRKKVVASNICSSLETARSKLRRLQDRPTVDEVNDKPFFPLRQRLHDKFFAEKLEQMMDRVVLVRGMEEEVKTTLNSLSLIHALLRDLERRRFASEIEKMWLKQAEEIIDEAATAIDNFTTPKPRQDWCIIAIFSDWIARFMLKKTLENSYRAYEELIDRKGKYNFEFTSRETSIPLFRPMPMQELPLQDIERVINRIRREIMLVPESKIRTKVIDEFKIICSELESLCELLKDKPDVDVWYNSRIVFAEQCRNIAQALEHSIESYINNYGFKVHLRGLEQIKQEVIRLKRSTAICRLKQIYQESSSVVGLDEDVHKLVSRLKDNNPNGSCSVVSIVGMMGIGKTTLAKVIYYQKSIINHFDVCAWVSVPTAFETSKVKAEVIPKGGEIQKVDIKELHGRLQDMRYLVVVDKVSRQKDWDIIKEALQLPQMTNGSRILITTRCNTLAAHTQQNCQCRPHKLRLRTKEESWMLFNQLIPLQGKHLKLAKKIVGRCGGLPLSIFSLGYLMSEMDMTEEELSRALARMNQGQNHTPWSNSKENNCNDLTRTDQDCLSYMRLFPRDFEIPARRLLNLWVATGLVQVDDEGEAERVAKKNLQKFIDLNTVQVVERKPNGEVKTCRLPSAFRELVFEDQNRTTRWSLCNTLDHHFAYHFDNDDTSLNHSHYFDSSSTNLFHKERKPFSETLLFFDTRGGKKPGEDIENFFRWGIIARENFRKLKVLDLERVYKPQLSQVVEKLVHLTYLGLRWTSLGTIPTSVGNLRKLQTLDVKHTDIRTLPSSIWKLQELRNLYLNLDYRCSFKHQPSSNCPKNLRTLWGLIIDDTSPLLHGLDMLTSIRNLKLAFNLESSKQKPLENWILRMGELNCLKLESMDEKHKPKDITLESLSALQKLKTLHLSGKLQGNIMSDLPKTLTEITLSATNLSSDQIQNLEKLPRLKSLSLHSNSHEGERMVCKGFPKLLVLRFWKLQGLRELVINEGAMPGLMELEIRSCEQLDVPIGLRHLNTLRIMKLKPESFKKKIDDMKELIWDHMTQPPSIIHE